MKRTLWVAGTLLAIGAGSAQAQGMSAMSASPWSFGIEGGGTIPVSDLSNYSSTGWNVGAIAGYNSPTMPFGLRFEVAYDCLGRKTYNFAGGEQTADFTLYD